MVQLKQHWRSQHNTSKQPKARSKGKRGKSSSNALRPRALLPVCCCAVKRTLAEWMYFKPRSIWYKKNWWCSGVRSSLALMTCRGKGSKPRVGSGSAAAAVCQLAQAVEKPLLFNA